MGEKQESYRYYVIYSFVDTEGRLRNTCRFVDRDGPIETSEDIESLRYAGFGRFDQVTVLDWKRIH